MTRVSETIDAIIKDVNSENGITIKLTENITNYLFKVVTFLGIPLIIYLLFQFTQGI